MEVHLSWIASVQKIISSPDMVDVMFNGTHIFMEEVNDTNQTCSIHYIKQPDNKLNVPVKSLKEKAAHKI
jgi:H-type small acid-soluble spore protein